MSLFQNNFGKSKIGSLTQGQNVEANEEVNAETVNEYGIEADEVNLDQSTRTTTFGTFKDAMASWRRKAASMATGSNQNSNRRLGIFGRARNRRKAANSANTSKNAKHSNTSKTSNKSNNSSIPMSPISASSKYKTNPSNTANNANNAKNSGNPKEDDRKQKQSKRSGLDNIGAHKTSHSSSHAESGKTAQGYEKGRIAKAAQGYSTCSSVLAPMAPMAPLPASDEEKVGSQQQMKQMKQKNQKEKTADAMSPRTQIMFEKYGSCVDVEGMDAEDKAQLQVRMEYEAAMKSHPAGRLQVYEFLKKLKKKQQMQQMEKNGDEMGLGNILFEEDASGPSGPSGASGASGASSARSVGSMPTISIPTPESKGTVQVQLAHENEDDEIDDLLAVANLHGFSTSSHFSDAYKGATNSDAETSSSGNWTDEYEKRMGMAAMSSDESDFDSDDWRNRMSGPAMVATQVAKIEKVAQKVEKAGKNKKSFIKKFIQNKWTRKKSHNVDDLTLSMSNLYIAPPADISHLRRDPRDPGSGGSGGFGGFGGLGGTPHAPHPSRRGSVSRTSSSSGSNSNNSNNSNNSSNSSSSSSSSSSASHSEDSRGAASVRDVCAAYDIIAKGVHECDAATLAIAELKLLRSKLVSLMLKYAAGQRKIRMESERTRSFLNEFACAEDILFSLGFNQVSDDQKYLVCDELNLKFLLMICVIIDLMDRYHFILLDIGHNRMTLEMEAMTRAMEPANDDIEDATRAGLILPTLASMGGTGAMGRMGGMRSLGGMAGIEGVGFDGKFGGGGARGSGNEMDANANERVSKSGRKCGPPARKKGKGAKGMNFRRDNFAPSGVSAASAASATSAETAAAREKVRRVVKERTGGKSRRDDLSWGDEEVDHSLSLSHSEVEVF